MINKNGLKWIVSISFIIKNKKKQKENLQMMENLISPEGQFLQPSQHMRNRPKTKFYD